MNNGIKEVYLFRREQGFPHVFQALGPDNNNSTCAQGAGYGVAWPRVANVVDFVLNSNKITYTFYHGACSGANHNLNAYSHMAGMRY